MSNASDNSYPDFQFTSPSMSTSATDGGTFRTIHGLARPRLARVRKSQHNRTVGGVSVSLKFDTSLNRLHPISDDCGRVWMSTITDKNLGVAADTDSMILGQLGKLQIGNQPKGSDYNSQTIAMHEGMVDKFTPAVGNIQGEGSVAVQGEAPRCQANNGFLKKHQLQYTSKQDDFSIPNTPSAEGTPFTGFNKIMEFDAMGSVQENLIGRMKVKDEEPALVQPWATSNSIPKERGFQHKHEPFESDTQVSPYQETEDANKSSRDAPEEFVYLEENHASNCCQQTQLAYKDTGHEDLIHATILLGINEGKNIGVGDGIRNVSSYCTDECVVDSSSEVSLSAFKAENLKPGKVSPKMSKDNKEVSSRRNDQAQSSGDCRSQFFSVPSYESGEGVPFKFSASSQAAAIRSHKKKIRTKAGQDPYNYLKNTSLSNPPSTIHFSLSSRGSAVLDIGIEHLSNHNCMERNTLVVDQIRLVKPGITSPSATMSEAKKDCEKWRLRGNQAYSSGDLDKAEAYYTQGVNCILKSEASRDELRFLMLCYNNRAAVRMSLQRFRDALMDCRAASEIDPNFFRVLVRKANCYLALGEVAEASSLLMKLLQLGTEVCVDRKLIVEASETFQKAQKVSQCIYHCTELLRKKTRKEAEVSLEAIEMALSTSPYSEKLLQMKTEALSMMHMYREVIQLCEQTLQTAEKNFPLLVLNHESPNLDPSEFLHHHCFRIWRYSFIFNSYFYLGKLEEGIDFLEKQLYLKSAIDRFGPQVVESLIPLVVSARVQVKHKSAGNEAYQAGKYAEAVEHYTIALACNAQSRPFAAVCVGNRAAAYQELGQITDAIADCNMAIALDQNYVKAISRRATLFERIKDYHEAASDLQKIISLVRKQAELKANPTEETDSLNSSQADLKQAHIRLAQLEELAIKEPPLDLYLILGVEPSATSADLKKAYRTAALKHHPDKACQLLTRSENIDDGVWKELSEEVQREAGRLFKIIGEAYSVVSDPTKRFLYEEEVRNALKKPSGVGGSRMRSDRSDGYQSSSSRTKTRKESWASSGNSRSRHFETSRSNRFF